MTPSTITTCGNCSRRNRVPAAAAGSPRCATCHAALAWIADAGDQDFVEIAERAPLPVLLNLWAPWRGPCRMVSPALEELARTFAGRIKLVKASTPRRGPPSASRCRPCRRSSCSTGARSSPGTLVLLRPRP